MNWNKARNSILAMGLGLAGYNACTYNSLKNPNEAGLGEPIEYLYHGKDVPITFYTQAPQEGAKRVWGLVEAAGLAGLVLASLKKKSTPAPTPAAGGTPPTTP